MEYIGTIHPSVDRPEWLFQRELQNILLLLVPLPTLSLP